MERVDDEDVKTMIALYCWNQSHQIDLIHLFAKLADVELAEDFTPLSEEHEVQDPYTVVSITFIDRSLDDINDEGANDDGNVNASLFENPNRDILICNDPRAHMSNIDLDVAHTSEFPEYPDILTTHWLVADSGREEPERPNTTRKKSFPPIVLDIRSMRAGISPLQTDCAG
ncbi:hypothetical protein PVK06_048260 [Gossypium arboreum]|uniref:Uncharacterized protein n=1 Tax=Gossypium arboreum TaxID=29729 RepID=A0ABR0MFH0_GOSAR|nr:hypothetical protein PVK06_048260 [Gossypium arboreum]